MRATAWSRREGGNIYPLLNEADSTKGFQHKDDGAVIVKFETPPVKWNGRYQITLVLSKQEVAFLARHETVKALQAHIKKLEAHISKLTGAS